MAQDEYITLMASLPALGPILAAKQLPVSPERLQKRLTSLRPEHRAELRTVSGLLQWPSVARLETDAAVVRATRSAMQKLDSNTLKSLLQKRMELRTLVAALRKRDQGEDAPPDGEEWGYGRFTRRIRSNWRDPGFGVESPFPWVLNARAALQKQDSTGFERIVLEAAWLQAAQSSTRHNFDFEAVALYLARWTLLDRWTRYDAEAASVRFSEMLTEALQNRTQASDEAAA